MRLARFGWVVVLLVFPLHSFASAPELSMRPKPRVENPPISRSVNHSYLQKSNAPDRSARPTLRAKRTFVRSQWAKNTDNSSTVSLRSNEKKPKKRLKNLFSKRAKSGSVCGVSGIEGAYVSSVVGKVKGCGVKDPVRVISVDRVKLSQAAIIDCDTAKALHSWVKNTVKPAVRRKGGGVKSLKVAAHYSCRTRNSKRGARISEHGKGKAIDISAINLKDGSSLTVLKDWHSRNRRIMAKIHKGACGPFGTVLGPKSDRYHQDHFHFDTARYRSGPFCR